MKKLITITLILFSFSASASSFFPDSTKGSFLSDININFMWFEIGGIYSIKEAHLKSLPNGMDKFLYNSKNGASYGFFSFSFYYKNKFGIELLPLLYYEIGNDEKPFNDYIINKFPNNYVAKYYWGSGYSLDGLAYRFCYRYQLKYFQVTTKFQMGFNNYRESSIYRTFKEKGSNQFIEYSIELENLKKYIFDYHLIVDISKRVNIPLPIEIGLKTEFMITPTSYQYTISETPYGGTPFINKLKVNQNHPAWGIGVVVRVIVIGTKENQKYSAQDEKYHIN